MSKKKHTVESDEALLDNLGGKDPQPAAQDDPAAQVMEKLRNDVDNDDSN
jgi:hypothetical protein